MLLNVLLLAWGLMQASVAFSSRTKSSRVRESLSWGNTGRKWEAGKGTQGKTTGKMNLRQLQREGECSTGRWDPLSTLCPPAKHPPAPATLQAAKPLLLSCPSSRLPPNASRAGWWGSQMFVVLGCGLCDTGQKGKNAKPITVYTYTATQNHFQSIKSACNVDYMINVLFFFLKVVFSWTMWFMPYWYQPF